MRHIVWPGIIAFVAVLIYGGSAWLLGRTSTPETAYYDQQAAAWLQGRLDIPQPRDTLDLTQVGGRWYLSFPPLPAILLLPWVGLSGVAGVNTVVFAAAIGAANVALTWLLLQALAQRGWSQLGTADTLWLTVLLGFGSVHWYMVTLGSVWFLAQTCALAGLLASVWLAVRGAPWWAGVALGFAVLGRPHLLLAAPLLLAIGHTHRRLSARWVAAVIMPGVLSLGLLLALNLARFGDPFDFGYLRQQVNTRLRTDLLTYGQFSLRYLPHNLWAMFLAGPVWDIFNRRMLPSVEGMSIWLTTPALLYLFRAKLDGWLARSAWLTIGLLLIPLLTYYNTGWWQFGYRFSLDLMPPIMVLLALAAGIHLSRLMRLAIVLGVLVNAWGVWWFLNPRYF